MNTPDIIIAIDGFSSTGKSSFAKMVAAELGFLYLDSGALYRGVTLFAREQGLVDESSAINLPALETALGQLDLHFRTVEGRSHMFMEERDIEAEIRTMEVSSQVSPVSAVPFVRAWVDDRLHKLSESGRVVMDGRDIGTTVFPDAGLKVFMTASVEVRTKRRYDELLSKGDNPDMEEVRRNLVERDYMDSHRETSPLKRADDAFLLDNSDMTFQEEISWIKGLIQGKFGILD